MKDLFEGIAYLFEEILFLPLNALRELQEESWFAANALNWLFMLIAAVALIYWLKQLKSHSNNNEDRQDIKAHPYLGKDAEL
ncbi:MAG: DUF6341 family protein [Bacteroidota bacterium]